jgi:hypothetical protein
LAFCVRSLKWTMPSRERIHKMVELDNGQGVLDEFMTNTGPLIYAIKAPCPSVKTASTLVRSSEIRS